MKVEVKEESNFADSEVLLARHRLTGALQDLVHQDADTASSEEDTRSKPNRTPIKKHFSLENTPPRPAKAKRRRLGNEANTTHHQSYVMKLFDRSVDLAQFEEDTPLYPICRAWMANQPRNPQIIIKRRLSSPEPNSKSLSVNGETEVPIGEVDRLPPPDPEMVNRVPSPLPEQIEKDMSTDFLNYNVSTPPSREHLLQSHQRRWSNVRRKWQDQARKYEDRYHASTNILTVIYHKAQENMV